MHCILRILIGFAGVPVSIASIAVPRAAPPPEPLHDQRVQSVETFAHVAGLGFERNENFETAREAQHALEGLSNARMTAATGLLGCPGCLAELQRSTGAQ